MTPQQIGEKLRALRTKAGLTQGALAGVGEGLDASVVSRWEKGEELRRLIRYAPELVEILGPSVWALVYAAAGTIHLRDDWEWCGPIAKALTDLLKEKTQKVPANTEPTTWKFTLPSLEEIAGRLGHAQPLSLQQQLHLAGAVECTDITRGWTGLRTEESPSPRRRRLTSAKKPERQG